MFQEGVGGKREFIGRSTHFTLHTSMGDPKLE